MQEQIIMYYISECHSVARMAEERTIWHQWGNW